MSEIEQLEQLIHEKRIDCQYAQWLIKSISVDPENDEATIFLSAIEINSCQYDGFSLVLRLAAMTEAERLAAAQAFLASDEHITNHNYI